MLCDKYKYKYIPWQTWYLRQSSMTAVYKLVCQNIPARQRSLRPSRTFNKNSAKINIEPDQTKAKEAPVIAQLSTDI